MRHRIARIDREIENRVLDLADVGDRRPKLACKRRLDLDRIAQGAPQYVGHAVRDFVQVERDRLQPLPPSDDEQAVGEPAAHLRRLVRTTQQVARLVIQLPQTQQLQITRDHGQEIVEVVRHAARKLANGLEFLRSEKGGLRFLAPLDFVAQSGGAFRDTRLERLLDVLTLRDVAKDADRSRGAPRAVEMNDPMRLNPTIAAVSQTQPKLDNIRTAATPGAFELGRDSLPVIRMNALEHGIDSCFVWRPIEQFSSGGIDIDGAASLVILEDAHLPDFERHAQSLLAVAKQLVRLHPG